MYLYCVSESFFSLSFDKNFPTLLHTPSAIAMEWVWLSVAPRALSSHPVRGSTPPEKFYLPLTPSPS